MSESDELERILAAEAERFELERDVEREYVRIPPPAVEISVHDPRGIPKQLAWLWSRS